MKIGPTKDFEVIKHLFDGDPATLPDWELWKDREDITVLVAIEDKEPKMMALLLDRGETKQPEVHICAPEPYRHAFQACNGFREWIKRYKTWKQVWSYTSQSDTRTFAFAKHLGFEHAFDEGERKFIVLNLNN